MMKMMFDNAAEMIQWQNAARDTLIKNAVCEVTWAITLPSPLSVRDT